MSKDLLDLDHVPTLEELRAFFKENDFSAAKFYDIDYENLSDTDLEILNAMEPIKKLMDEHWEPLSREMGLKSHSGYYGKDNPLIAMRDNFEELVSSGVYKLIDEHPEKTEEILSQFTDDPNIEENADKFLHNAIETAMKTMSYEEVAKVVKEIPAYEDFNHENVHNYRAKDFDRKWNHTRTNIETVSLDESKENGVTAHEEIADAQADVAEEVLENILQEKFWSAISDDDKKLLKMRMSGMNQKEIAEKLGYKTHSAVTKRLQKLKEVLENIL